MRTLTIGAALAASMLVLAACGGDEEATADPAAQTPVLEEPALDATQDPAIDDPAADAPADDELTDGDGDDASGGEEGEDSADAVVTPLPDDEASE